MIVRADVPYRVLGTAPGYHGYAPDLLLLASRAGMCRKGNSSAGRRGGGRPTWTIINSCSRVPRDVFWQVNPSVG